MSEMTTCFWIALYPHFLIHNFNGAEFGNT